MDKNFKVRLIVSICLFLVATVGFYAFDSIPFKAIFTFIVIMATIELFSFFWKSFAKLNWILALIQLGLLAGSLFFVYSLNVHRLWYIVIGICGYDIFAYLFGKMLGGKIFKKSRPFPRISKNKTWEGTFLGLFTATLIVVIYMLATNSFASDWVFLFSAPLALIGDLFESWLKRRSKVKDSNEIIIKNKFFAKIEMLMGGSSGHGGFLDRVDSTTLAGTIIYIIYCLI